MSGVNFQLRITSVDYSQILESCKSEAKEIQKRAVSALASLKDPTGREGIKWMAPERVKQLQDMEPVQFLLELFQYPRRYLPQVIQAFSVEKIANDMDPEVSAITQSLKNSRAKKLHASVSPAQDVELMNLRINEVRVKTPTYLKFLPSPTNPKTPYINDDELSALMKKNDWDFAKELAERIIRYFDHFSVDSRRSAVSPSHQPVRSSLLNPNRSPTTTAVASRAVTPFLDVANG